MFDPSSGKLVSAKLNTPRLRKGAVPSKIPGAPSYLSQVRTLRICPDRKKEIYENKQLCKAISESLKSKAVEDKKDFLTTHDELLEKIQSHLKGKWCAFKHDSGVTLAIIKRNPAPVITHSVVIDSDFQLKAFIASHELKNIESHLLPMPCKSIKVLCDVLENLKKIEQKDGDTNDTLVAHTILCLEQMQAADDEKKNLAFLVNQLSS